MCYPFVIKIRIEKEEKMSILKEFTLIYLWFAWITVCGWFVVGPIKAVLTTLAFPFKLIPFLPLAIVNLLALADDTSRNWRKLAIGGNILILLYALVLAPEDIVAYYSLLIVMFITFMYLLFLIWEEKQQQEMMRGG
jgi:hypothetical protein